jgi:hypothetical protein
MNFKEFTGKGILKINYVSIIEFNPNLKEDINNFLQNRIKSNSERNIILRQKIFKTLSGKRILLNDKNFFVLNCRSGFPNITIIGTIIGTNDKIEESFNSLEFCKRPDMIQVYVNHRRYDEVDPYGEEDDWDIYNEEYEHPLSKLSKEDQKYKEMIGKLVKCVGTNFGIKEPIGKIIMIYPNESYVGVEFEDNINGHDCNGFGGIGKPGKYGHCWNVEKRNLIFYEKDDIKEEDIEWF